MRSLFEWSGMKETNQISLLLPFLFPFTHETFIKQLPLLLIAFLSNVVCNPIKSLKIFG